MTTFVQTAVNIFIAIYLLAVVGMAAEIIADVIKEMKENK